MGKYVDGKWQPTFGDDASGLVDAKGYNDSASRIRALESQLTQANERIKALENPWVSCKERSPEEGQWYLCISRNRSEILFFDSTNEDGVHVWLQDGDYLERVTHWMPIPIIPENTNG